MKTKLSKLMASFSGLIMLLISNFALADTGASGQISVFGSDAVSKHTDLSISYLSQLLGTVGNVIHGASGQMMGMLFYKFNAAVLIVAGLWLGYTVFTIVLKAAHSGSFMGQQQNQLLVFVRIAVGFAMLFPSPATGYSIFQDIVAKVVVYSVKLADETWDQALTYMQNGGVLYQQPASQQQNPLGKFNNPPTPTQWGKDAPSVAIANFQTILSSEVCMYQANAVRGQPYGMQINASTKQLLFPGPDNKAGQTLTNPECGSASWSVANTYDPNTKLKEAYMEQAVYEVAVDLDPVARQIANYYPSATSNTQSAAPILPGDLTTTMTDTLTGSVLDYIQIGIPITRIDNTQALLKQKENQFFKDARSDGWITAGQYYWNLIMFNNAVLQQAANALKLSQPPKGPQLQTIGRKAFNQANEFVINPGIQFTTYSTLQQEMNTNSQDNGNFSIKIKHAPGEGSGLVNKIKYLFYRSIIQPFEDLLSVNVSPMIWLHTLGVDCIKAAGSMFVDFVLVVGTIALALGAIPSITISGVANAVGGLLKGILMPLFMIFTIGGIILAFYIPLYPYLLFILGAVGWMILVIEAMVAAPLVMLGLTHPEGHDFLGKAEQALILLLSVFIRPVLMVMGLIIGMILSYVALEFVMHSVPHLLAMISGMSVGHYPSPNWPGFHGISGHGIAGGSAQAWGKAMSQLASNILAVLLSQYGPIMTAIVFAVINIIFVMIIYQICIKSFSLIYALPNNVLRWIGGLERPDDSAQLAGEIRGVGVQVGSQAAQSIGKGFGVFDKKSAGGGNGGGEDDDKDSEKDNKGKGKGK